MPRHERPLDPGSGPLQRFAHDLRRLRAAAGNPTYRVLARSAGYSASTLSEAAGGFRKPSLDVVLAFVGACGGNPETWTRRWHKLDPSPRRGATGTPQAAPPVLIPRQLPAAAPHFAGRQAELQRLTALLGAGGDAGRAMVISAVGGTAGVGKTALAVHWAHQVAADFPDGQLYVNLRGYDPGRPLSPADVLTRFLGALGFSGPLPSDVDDLAARFRTEIAGRRMLVVLDNASSVEQVRPLLPGTASCVVVVTSRDSLAGLIVTHGAHRIGLDLLSMPEARELLSRLIGTREAEEPTAVLALAECCGRLPLALRIAAEVATARPGTTLAELVAELADRQRRLQFLDAGDDSHAALTAVFSWSTRRLPPGPARLFRLLGLHPGPDLDAPAAAALAATSVEQAHRDLLALTRAHLVDPTTAGRYGMHDLLRAYASSLVPAGEAQAQRRLFDYYLHATSLAMDRLRPAEKGHRPAVPESPAATSFADLEEAHAWLDRERAALVALTGHAAAHGWTGHAVPMSGLLFNYLDGGHFADALAVHGHALRAAREAGDITGEAYALRGLGSTNLWLGRPEPAGEQLRQAQTLFQLAGEYGGEARTELSLGLLARRLGRFEESSRHYDCALVLSRQDGDPIGEARALTNLAVNEARHGHHYRAAERLEYALALSERCGDHFGEAFALTNLGLVEQRLDRLKAAAGHHLRAAALFRRLGNRHGEAHTLDNLGSLHLAGGEPEPAARYFRQAMELFRTLGDRDSQILTRNGLGAAARAAGRPKDAVAEHTVALTLAVAAANPEQQARAHEGLGRAYEAQGDLRQARRHLREALHRYASLGLPEADAIRARLAGSAAVG